MDWLGPTVNIHVLNTKRESMAGNGRHSESEGQKVNEQPEHVFVCLSG